tara:strand:- start:34 stop:825 length:792 start_codon:yes stop_codon:yes gene_type:complete
MLPRKVINEHHESKLKGEGNILNSVKKITFNKNLDFLLKKRFSYIERYLKKDDMILELGCGAGHSKNYIKNKNLKISDITNYDFLDFKNVDCLNTPFKNDSFDCVFSLSLIHHIPNPMKLFNEIGRILKKNGKYIILDVNCCFFFKLITILTKSEKYDLDVNIYNEEINLTDPNDTFDSNNAVPSLIFEDFEKFNNKLKYNFEINDLKFQEFFTFLNSGGVIIDAPYLPLNKFLLKLLDNSDNFLSRFKKIFPLHIYCCLEKK